MGMYFSDSSKATQLVLALPTAKHFIIATLAIRLLIFIAMELRPIKLST